ncbi:undecaprenyl-phosphate glucose phosphotransferase [Vibrio tapetis]|uniref:Putative UDP-sugar lipid carrier transferase n=1 Tax=Vibrio tapetis subsp. tapetis TaxID=1671868 RepID=A0A2N8ZLM3_9VIBR|nr:undecaprenyl-phosphate glucose phosphotransferase [Vibrio tapetis]SON52792.1 putative UDP-sugar lipid carrier transferase [Vibrio tapetis subsp. tapetis]
MKINLHGSEHSILHRLVDVIVIILSHLICAKLYEGNIYNHHLIATCYAIILYMFMAETLGLYRSLRASSIREQILSLFTSWATVVALLLFVSFFSKTSIQYSRIVSASWFALTPIIMVLWRVCSYQFSKLLIEAGYNRQKAIIVGVTESGIALAKQIEKNAHLGIDIVGFYDDRKASRLDIDSLSCSFKGPVQDGLDLTKANKVDQVYVALPMKAEIRNVEYLKQFSDTTANTYLIPDFFVYNLIQSRFSTIGNIPTLSVHDTPFYGFSTWIKRAQDIIASTLILILISPVLLTVGLGVKLSSPGPIIFKQIRYGLDGRKIEVWKFRSMRSMENGSVVKQATKNDPRVTPCGAFIRRTSLDELPQFFNVLQGSMSIVGPRPHAVAHNEEYRSIVDRYMLRHKVKPGITGLAQINGYRGETDTLEKMEKRVEYDLKYINTWSTTLDIKIIFLTAFKGFVGKTAY